MQLPDDMLDIDQAAAFAGVSKRTIRDWADRGAITRYQRGRAKRKYYSRKQIEDFLQLRPVEKEEKHV